MTITLSHQELKDLLLMHEKAIQAWTKNVMVKALELATISIEHRETTGVSLAKKTLETLEAQRPIFTLL